MAVLKSTTTQREGWHWGAYVVVAVTALTALTVFWARDRGLDLTDEGYYLQLYAHPESAPPNAAASQFYHLVDVVSGPFDLGITGYRTLGLVLLLAVGLVFGLAVYRFAARWFPEFESAMAPRPVGVSLIMLAGLLGYAWAPLTLSYNTLAAALVQLILASTLWATSFRSDEGGMAPVLLAGLGGAFVPFLFYAKWPSVLAVSVLVVLITFVSLGRRGWTHIAAYVGTSVVIFGVTTKGIGPGPFSFSELMDSSSRIADGAYSPAKLVFQYMALSVKEIALIVVGDLPRVIALFVLFAGWSILSSRLRSRPRLHWFLVVVATLFLITEIPRAAYLDATSSFEFVLAAAVALGLAIFVARVITTGELPELIFTRWSARGVAVATFVLVLLGAPIASVVGTNNHILTASMHGGAGYGALIIFGAGALAWIARDGTSVRHAIALPVVAVVIAAQVVNGVVVDPYRLPTSRTDQSEAIVGIPRLAGIRFDSAGARFIEESHRIVTEKTSFQPGDTVLAFALLPGLIYAIDGVSPAALWVLPVESGEQGRICESLRSASAAVASTTVVIQNSDPSSDLAGCLSELLPGYPESFVEAGRVPIPDSYGAGTGLGTTLRIFELDAS